MNKKGFTLIEMLVVIAIIAVLVSIVIPTVGSATEKAKEAADVANVRSAIAEVTTNALGNGTTTSKAVKMTQGTDGFVSTDLTSIGGLDSTAFTAISNATKGEAVVIAWDATNNKVTATVHTCNTTGANGSCTTCNPPA